MFQYTWTLLFSWFTKRVIAVKYIVTLCIDRFIGHKLSILSLSFYTIHENLSTININPERTWTFLLFCLHHLFYQQKTQFKRGGLSLCLNDERVAAAFRNLYRRGKRNPPPVTSQRNTCRNENRRNQRRNQRRRTRTECGMEQLQ